METTDAPTPRETRHRLNRMERWCEANAAALGPRVVHVRALFEVAEKPWHADHIAALLR